MISTGQKVFVGAIGAICLGLLKLIGANFYLAAQPNEKLGAYLTTAAYVCLGMALGCLFCEDGVSPDKTR
jgi:hypothetical protein